MAVTAALVFQRPSRIYYLLTQDGNAGTTLTITTTGAATPDLLTDSVAGPIRQLAKAFTVGYGQIGPGALTQVQSRGLWLSARGTAIPTTSPGSIDSLATARCEIMARSGATVPAWIVDANVDGSGNPTILITAQAGAGTAYLFVEMESGMNGA